MTGLNLIYFNAKYAGHPATGFGDLLVLQLISILQRFHWRGKNYILEGMALYPTEVHPLTKPPPRIHYQMTRNFLTQPWNLYCQTLSIYPQCQHNSWSASAWLYSTSIYLKLLVESTRNPSLAYH